MRMMLKVQVPVEQGNAALADGSLPQTIQRLAETVRPEAAYFAVMDGKRTALFFFDMTESSQMPVIGEPLFGGLNASLELTPVMTQDELQRGIQQWMGAR